MAQQDWLIVNGNVSVEGVATARHQARYDLLNITEGECIRYGERRWGINLVWDDPRDGDNIRFVAKDGSATVNANELIAISVRNGGYLKYQRRDYGINLVWSDTPSFEWQLTANDQPPKNTTAAGEIKTNQVVGIWNTVEKDFLIYAPRPVGINRRWYKDRNKGGSLIPGWLDDAVDAAKAAGVLLAAIA